MKRLFLAGAALLALAAAGCTTTQERVSGAGAGAVVGAVAGPPGMVVGGVAGAIAGPSIARAGGVRHRRTYRHYRRHRVVHHRVTRRAVPPND